MHSHLVNVNFLLCSVLEIYTSPITTKGRALHITKPFKCENILKLYLLVSDEAQLNM